MGSLVAVVVLDRPGAGTDRNPEAVVNSLEVEGRSGEAAGSPAAVVGGRFGEAAGNHSLLRVAAGKAAEVDTLLPLLLLLLLLC